MCKGNGPFFKIEEAHEPFIRNPRAATTRELYYYFGTEQGKYNTVSVMLSVPMRLQCSFHPETNIWYRPLSLKFHLGKKQSPAIKVTTRHQF